jgi:hypothetical protein
MRKLISIPDSSLSKLKECAKRYYGGNFSRFVTDAGLFYGNSLDKLKTEKINDNDCITTLIIQ